MKELLRKGRDKLTKPLLCLIVPLTVLPFFWEQDTISGKILLVTKFGLMALLWLLHAELISLPENIGLGLVACSMALTVKLRDGVGIALLFMILFFCLLTFPRIRLSAKFRRWLFFALGISVFGFAIYGIQKNINAGLTVFDMKGFLYPNTSGLLFVASYLFLQCFMSTMKKTWIKWLTFGLFTLLFAGPIYQTGCRSAMMSMAVFLPLFIVLTTLNKEGLFRFCHVAILICTVLICGVFLYLSYGNPVTNQELTNASFLGKKFMTGRERVWQGALEYIGSNFVLGCGNQYNLSDASHIYFSSAHSVPIGIMLCMGTVPTLYYFFLQFRPGTLYSLKEKCTTWQRMPAICFMAAMAITAFECSLTDAQLNFLFLPLLLGCAPEQAKPEEVTHG